MISFSEFSRAMEGETDRHLDALKVNYCRVNFGMSN